MDGSVVNSKDATSILTADVRERRMNKFQKDSRYFENYSKSTNTWQYQF